jgi:hypothetical protein
VASAVTHAQLGSVLRAFAGSASALGASHRWLPVHGSAARASWDAAKTDDPLELTLTEADVHGVTLLRSALEHVDAVGSAVSGRRAYLPVTIGRSAVEHALRVQHLLDADEAPLTRARRRLDEWLYAVTESGFQRVGIQKASHPGSESMPDESAMVERIRLRAQELGFEMVKQKRTGYRVSERGRASTMRLAEDHLGAGGAGVPRFLIQNHGAVVHGVETGLLASAKDREDPETGLNVPEPAIADPPALAFGLMCVPLSAINAVRAVVLRFGWPDEGAPARRYMRDRDRLLEQWERAVTGYLDEHAPDRPRSGVFGELVK